MKTTQILFTLALGLAITIFTWLLDFLGADCISSGGDAG
jgi:hypothetical protein